MYTYKIMINCPLTNKNYVSKIIYLYKPSRKDYISYDSMISSIKNNLIPYLLHTYHYHCTVAL